MYKIIHACIYVCIYMHKIGLIYTPFNMLTTKAGSGQETVAHHSLHVLQIQTLQLHTLTEFAHSETKYVTYTSRANVCGNEMTHTDTRDFQIPSQVRSSHGSNVVNHVQCFQSVDIYLKGKHKNLILRKFIQQTNKNLHSIFDTIDNSTHPYPVH